MTKSPVFKIATTQYLVQQFSDWQAYASKITQLVKSAKAQGTDLLMLPEYAGLELAGWIKGDLSQQFSGIQELLSQYLELFQSLAQQHQIYILAGSIPVKVDGKYFHNRAFFFNKQGKYTFQDKIQMTQFEVESGLIQSGDTLKVFDTTFGKIAIAICYDSEFATLVEQLIKAGADLILVPSCTEGLWGFNRVQIACKARAMENQCFVAQACLVGNAAWCEFIDTNAGQAGVFSPVDTGFSEDGVLALGTLNQDQMVMAELNRDKLETVRKQGQVRNFYDQKKLETTLQKIDVVNETL